MSSKTMPTDKARTMVYMPEELKEKLKKIADEDNRSLSNLILTILQQYVETEEAKKI